MVDFLVATTTANACLTVDVQPRVFVMTTPDDKPAVMDEFSYLETGGFSSERFKIEVNNLPKFYGISEFRKLLTSKLKLNPVKVKPPHKKSKYLFVCFPNEDEKTKAISLLDGYQWKGSKLVCKTALPTPDPLVKKRKSEAADSENSAKKIDTRSQEEKLKDSSIPYWNIKYDKQVEMKQKSMRDVLLKLGNELWIMNKDLRDLISKKRKIHDGLICEFGPIKTAPKIEEYRNKCEFTIGFDIETNLPTVGFRLGSYVSGFTGVAPVDNLCHIPKEMKKAVLLFQEFVRSSELKAYSPEDHSGFWKQLTVRQSVHNNDLMLIISLCSQDLSEEVISDLNKSLVEYLTNDNVKEHGIKSIYFLRLPKRTGFGVPTPNVEHLFGETHIFDYIHGLKFRISPQSFFQVNTGAAEILYQSAIDLSDSQNNSTVIDICCGTGTIGLCFSKHCDQVLGLEMVSEAVDDARSNATFNECKNAEFFCGKAEDILSSVVARAKNEDVIAIVDPPRSGLHMRAVVQLRRIQNIKRVVYISCNPAAAMKNFVDLGRASSKTMHGDPFFLTKAIAVDMFPFTKHTEMVLLFERLEEDEPTVTPSESSSITTENVDVEPKNVPSNCE
ncbi:tRNA (uracil-5-)-methyltransferase homolog A [Arctopsyche grandis]|uniref:tRNA (uracil-5-)-methyltransferase homolog A n=1 Tax=Arctopsyche grandis TaxID=121162 RepID=UPI00406D97B1